MGASTVPNGARKRMPMRIAGSVPAPRAAALGCAFAFGAFAFGVLACDGGTARRPAAAGKSTVESTGTTATVPAHERRPDDGPIMNGDHSVIREEAVGPLRVGEWRRPVMSFVYAISARAGRDSEDIIVVRGIGKDTVTLTFANDTLRRVFITHTGPRTADGIGVGTPFAEVAGKPDARITTRGRAQIASVAHLCGVEFATDSTALSADSLSHSRPEQPAIVRAISVGYCKP